MLSAGTFVCARVSIQQNSGCGPRDSVRRVWFIQRNGNFLWSSTLALLRLVVQPCLRLKLRCEFRFFIRHVDQEFRTIVLCKTAVWSRILMGGWCQLNEDQSFICNLGEPMGVAPWGLDVGPLGYKQIHFKDTEMGTKRHTPNIPEILRFP